MLTIYCIHCGTLLVQCGDDASTCTHESQIASVCDPCAAATLRKASRWRQRVLNLMS